MATNQLRADALSMSRSRSMTLGTYANELPGSKSLKDGGQLWQEWLKRLDAVGRGGEDNHGDGQLIQVLLKLDALIGGQQHVERFAGLVQQSTIVEAGPTHLGDSTNVMPRQQPR